MRVIASRWRDRDLRATTTSQIHEVAIDLVEPVGVGDRVARPRGRGDRVKYVDEFRDAELGQVLAGEILAEVEPGATTR